MSARLGLATKASLLVVVFVVALVVPLTDGRLVTHKHGRARAAQAAGCCCRGTLVDEFMDNRNYCRFFAGNTVLAKCDERCKTISLDEERPMVRTARKHCWGWGDGESGECTDVIHKGGALDVVKGMVLPTATKLVLKSEHKVPITDVAKRPRATGAPDGFMDNKDGVNGKGIRGVYGGAKLRRRRRRRRLQQQEHAHSAAGKPELAPEVQKVVDRAKTYGDRPMKLQPVRKALDGTSVDHRAAAAAAAPRFKAGAEKAGAEKAGAEKAKWGSQYSFSYTNGGGWGSNAHTPATGWGSKGPQFGATSPLQWGGAWLRR